MSPPPKKTHNLPSKITMKDDSTLSKRQKLKQKNEKHAMPQFPHIKDPKQRANAYLRTSGLTQEPKTAIDPNVDLQSTEMKYCKLLAATDQKVRHQAVLILEKYLKDRCDVENEAGGLSAMDLLKLWKGLWHTLYMADRAPVQDELSKRIANLIWSLAGTEEEDEYAGQCYLNVTENEEQEMQEQDSDEEVVMEEIINTLDNRSSDEDSEESEDSDGDHGQAQSDSEDDDEQDESEVKHCRGAHLASLFVRTFFQTVHRDWGIVDKYRVDKFYTLMRYVMRQVFTYMAKRHWNRGIVRLFNDAIWEEVLIKKPNGIRFHLVDLVLEELAQVNKDAPLPLTEATYIDVVEDYFKLLQIEYEDDSLLQSRVAENVHSRFLKEYSFVAEEMSDLTFDNVHVGTVGKMFFDMGSEQNVSEEERKVLYNLHKMYKRQIKKAGRDVDLETDQEDESFAKEDDIVDAEEEVESTEEDLDSLEKDEYEADADTPVKKVQLKKRKKVLESENEDPSEQALSKKRKRKKKDKKAKHSESAAQETDEVLTISVNEQKMAKAALKTKTGSTKVETKKQESISQDTDGEKKVKFGAVNQARSWKVSMRNLKTKELSSPASTPDRGILREPKFTKKSTTKRHTKVKRKSGISR